MLSGSASIIELGALLIRSRALGHVLDCPLDHAGDALAAERVVLRDHLVGHADERQHECSEDAGAVLARRAMEHRGVGVVLGEQAQRTAERALAGHEHLAVAVDEERRRVAQRLDLLGAPHDVEHGMVVVLDDVGLEGEATVFQRSRSGCGGR